MAKLNLPSRVLKQRRLDMGLTQAKLAARAGIEQSQISKIERSLDVRLSTLMKLLTALDLDLLLAPRARPGANVGTIDASLPPLKVDIRGAMGQPHHFDAPSGLIGRDYPIPGTSDRFRPKTGTLLERFAISEDEDVTKYFPPRPVPSPPPAPSPRSAPPPSPRTRKK